MSWKAKTYTFQKSLQRNFQMQVRACQRGAFVQYLEGRGQAEVILLVRVVADWLQQMYLHGQTPRPADGHRSGRGAAVAVPAVARPLHSDHSDTSLLPKALVVAGFPRI